MPNTPDTSLIIIAHAGSYGGISIHLNQFYHAVRNAARIGHVYLFAVNAGVVIQPQMRAQVTLRTALSFLWQGQRWRQLLLAPAGFLREICLTGRDAPQVRGQRAVIVSHDPNAFWGYALRATHVTYCLYVTPPPATENLYKRPIIYVWRMALHSLIAWRMRTGRLTLVTPTAFAAETWARYLFLSPEEITLLPSPPFLLNPVSGLIADTQPGSALMPEIQTLHQQGKRLVIAVGHMEDYKNPLVWATLANALQSSFPDTVFVWAGDGSLLEEVRSLTRHNPNVVLTGRLNQDDLRALYRISWALLHPATKESQGIVVMDALTFGLPVILNNREALPGLIAGSAAGYVLDFNAADAPLRLSETLRGLQEPSTYASCRASALALAAERYSYGAWSQKIGQLCTVGSTT